MGRLPVPGVRHLSGDIEIGGESIFALSDEDLRKLRQASLGFVFQDPIGTLDPTRKVGAQLRSTLPAPATTAAVEAALGEVGLPDPRRVARSYPHELSGGMAQRVAIAMAIGRGPRIVVADEPTAALDASIKDVILDLLVVRCRRLGAALLLFSHDLHAIRTRSDRVAVMYGGRVVETGAAADVLERPVHPYTLALLASAIGRERPGERVEPITGAPPILTARLEACPFAPRCAEAIDRCRTVRPEPRTVAGRAVVCHRAEEFVQIGSAA
jgi:oligopeptide/dipeptide ABC transporter ATP-binding protein